MKIKLAQFTTILLLALVMGVFWGTWFTLTRSIENFSPAEFIHIGKVIIANVAMPMRIIMPASILFVLISIWLYPAKKSGQFYLLIAALVLIIVTLLITVLIEVPIDNQIKSWTANTIPSDWEAIRAQWQLFHTVRTFTSIAALGIFLAGSLF